MARNKGRRPADASKPTPESRPASPGPSGNGGSANGTTDAQRQGTAPRSGGAPAARPRDDSPPPANPASASPAGAAQPSIPPASAAAGPQPSGPGAPSAGAPGSSGRPPSTAGGPPPGGSGPGGPAPAGPSRGRPPGGTAPPPAGGSHRSFRNGLIGGLVGGIAAAAVLAYLLQPGDDGELQALRAQVDQLNDAVEGVQGGTAALDQLTSRIDALEQAAPAEIDEELRARLDALQQSSPGALNEELQARLVALEEVAPAAEDLASRIEALENSLASGAPAAGADERIAALQEELAELSATVAAQALGEGDATASDLALLETLQSRLAAIEAELPDSEAAAEVALRLDALAARLDALEPLGEQSAGNQELLAGLGSQIEGLDQQIEGLREQLGGLRSEVEGQASRLAATEDRVASAGDRRERAAALALLANQIDAAIDQSRGYEEPLRSLAALGEEDETVRQAASDLAPSASGGIPSLAQLRRSFEPVAGEIVRQARAPEGDGLLDQAASNLLRLVTVRPVGADVEGDGAAARVARAEAHLAAGDLAAAVVELEGLEGPAAEAAAPWLAEARKRLAASAALDRLQTRTGELLTPTN